MRKIMNVLCNTLFAMAFVVSTVSVNATCSNKLYQEKLSDDLNSLRKNV